MARDIRLSELLGQLERMGAPVTEAVREADARAMHTGLPLSAALRSVAEDYAQGLWPDELTYSEPVGESWSVCAFCLDDFLPDGPDDYLYCSETCKEDDRASL